MSVVALGRGAATALRVLGLGVGGCGVVNGRRATAAARRTRAKHLLQSTSTNAVCLLLLALRPS